MILVLVVFLAGVLTILSPCILPVLPFVFAQADKRFLSSGLPLLIGMACAFCAIASLAAVGGSWAVSVNQYGRIAALLLMTAFAATLLSRTLADWMARPLVALGNRLVPATTAAGGRAGAISSGLLGVATGLLWAPCAGPILGLVLTGAAIAGPNAHTTLLLFAYAAGAATSLGVALLAGARVFTAMKRSLGAGEWLRRGLGIAVLLGVVAIAFGWDTRTLSRLSLSSTGITERWLLKDVAPGDGSAAQGLVTGRALPDEGRLPSLGGATQWLNSPPLSAASLRGKVVLVDFWTYSCINCLRTLPYVKSWYDKYRDHGLVVVGVHAPEFAFEKDPGNVRRAVADLGIAYPVALDNDYAIWQAFGNHYWPAHYFIDAAGIIRGHHFAEGDYRESELLIRELLTQAGDSHLPPLDGDAPRGITGVQAAADVTHDQSPETYLGFRRATAFMSPGGFMQDRSAAYAMPPSLGLNEWALSGEWQVESQVAVLGAAGGRISFHFLARDLHLVLGPGADGKPVRFRVTLDGREPGASHGVDIDASGRGVVEDQRLYQLIRQSGDVGEHMFGIEFLDGGVQAYAFTFG